MFRQFCFPIPRDHVVPQLRQHSIAKDIAHVIFILPDELARHFCGGMSPSSLFGAMGRKGSRGVNSLLQRFSIATISCCDFSPRNLPTREHSHGSLIYKREFFSQNLTYKSTADATCLASISGKTRQRFAEDIWKCGCWVIVIFIWHLKATQDFGHFLCNILSANILLQFFDNRFSEFSSADRLPTPDLWRRNSSTKSFTQSGFDKGSSIFKLNFQALHRVLS